MFINQIHKNKFEKFVYNLLNFHAKRAFLLNVLVTVRCVSKAMSRKAELRSGNFSKLYSKLNK